MNTTYTFDEKNIEHVHALYKQVWWAKDRTFTETKHCVENSQVCIGLQNNNNELIGFTRILTDFTFKAIIFDVIVDKNYRGRGLGKQLILESKKHQKLQHVKHFELYCLPDMEALYSSLNFSTEVGNVKLMRCEK